MSDFQKFLDQALDQVNLKPVKDTQEILEYDIEEEVRNSIIAVRSMLNITQKELAQRSGVSQANISKIENGKYHPSLATLKRIADALGKRLVISFEDPEV